MREDGAGQGGSLPERLQRARSAQAAPSKHPAMIRCARQTMSQTVSGLTVGETYHLTFDWAATQYEFVNGPSFGCTGCWVGATTNEMEVSLRRRNSRHRDGGRRIAGLHRLDDGVLRLHGRRPPQKRSSSSRSEARPAFPRSRSSPMSRSRATFRAAVPEPATWAMMGMGFAGLGLVAYRRRRKAVAIA